MNTIYKAIDDLNIKEPDCSGVAIDLVSLKDAKFLRRREAGLCQSTQPYEDYALYIDIEPDLLSIYYQ